MSNNIRNVVYKLRKLYLDDDSYLSDLLFFIDCNNATKKNAFCIMQALCQITPTGKLTDSYDKNKFKK